MPSVLLTGAEDAGKTMVPNIFIDKYMPEAHGDFVKVYLYLLRNVSAQGTELSISALADRFENTERDILKALYYWEDKKLLDIEREPDGELRAVHIKFPEKAEDKTATPKEVLRESVQGTAVSSQVLAQAPPQEISQDEISQNSVKTSFQVFPRPVYTMEQITQMQQDRQVNWLLKNVESYLKRLLKPDDVQLVLYLYESLNFSPELILYLYEYCISMNKTHRSYIEAVALNWNRDGIYTVEQAALAGKQYRKEYYTVANALGVSRQLADAQCAFIEKWLHHWKMPLEVVLEACKRTALQAQTPDFRYADRILKSWYEAGIVTLADIKKADDAYEHVTWKKIQDQRTTTGRKTASSNRFHSFEQHQYSREDIDEQERVLLRKSSQKVR